GPATPQSLAHRAPPKPGPPGAAPTVMVGHGPHHSPRKTPARTGPANRPGLPDPKGTNAGQGTTKGEPPGHTPSPQTCHNPIARQTHQAADTDLNHRNSDSRPPAKSTIPERQATPPQPWRRGQHPPARSHRCGRLPQTHMPRAQPGGQRAPAPPCPRRCGTPLNRSQPLGRWRGGAPRDAEPKDPLQGHPSPDTAPPASRPTTPDADPPGQEPPVAPPHTPTQHDPGEAPARARPHNSPFPPLKLHKPAPAVPQVSPREGVGGGGPAHRASGTVSEGAPQGTRPRCPDQPAEQPSATH
ncbi:basic proline-rich protein-like, partial [Gouania willdenowi]|uniref:basic proline-rich protein-like n=1 Tax=Gouania willdenowi TaxID=441366 RepID=UPI0010551852